MAEATTQIRVTPKQLGKHLRSIRRKKGLSLSEVARGAGLSRRELGAYERGKIPIPESDLWVLAGSCGVDVAELMPSASSLELTAAANATSVGDTVSQLRRGQDDAGVTAYLHTLQKLQALPAGKRIPVKERDLEEIATALGSTPRSIEEKLQEVLNVSPDEAERLRAMILVPPNTKGRPRALSAAPSAVAAAAAPPPIAAAPTPTVVADTTPSADPFAVPEPFAETTSLTAPAADAPAFAEPVQTFPAAPAAFLDRPIDAPVDDVHGHNIDVFEELARLPEPVPLGDPSAPMPDLLAPQDPFADPFAGVPAIGPPEGAVELVDSTMPAGATAGAGTWNAADAPPIDVAMRQGSATWDLGEPPLIAKTTDAAEPSNWESGSWQPPVPEGTNGTTNGFWEGTDDWTPQGEPPADLSASANATELVDPPDAETLIAEAPIAEAPVLGQDTWAGSAWDAQPSSPTETVADDTAVDVNPWTTDEWPREPADRGAWDHHPDPAAVDTGFYVDWGTDETEAPPGWDAPVEQAAGDAADLVDVVDVVDAPAAWDIWSQTDTTEVVETEVGDDRPSWEQWTPANETVEFVDSVETVEVLEPVDADQFVTPSEGLAGELTHISWRADGSPVDQTAEVAMAAAVLAATSDAIAPTDLTPIEEWSIDSADTIVEPTVEAPTPEAPTPEPPTPEPPTPEAEAQPVVEQFVTAGPDWQLGNALPLVEVRGQGGLVMRRADERWALADVTTTPDFVAEVEVDFRSGPGLGVLFRASIDDEGRMSGYSFDIDPIYDGGGYLVRQWQSDRELWNPIARVGGDDPTSMYGTLLVRLEVVGEHLSAQINGVEVLVVDNLKQASVDRGRDAADGDRLGVQAWSSSDLVIDSVRVATR